MSFEDLFNGLRAFDQGIQEYKINQTIGDARKAIQELNSKQLKEEERNVAMSQLGNDLTLRLGQIGAPISQIQSAVGAIKPNIASSPMEAFMQAQAFGGSTGKAEAAQAFGVAPQASLQAAGSAAEDRRLQQKLANDRYIAELQSGAKRPRAPVVPGFIQTDPNVELSPVEIKDLRKGSETLRGVSATIQRLKALIDKQGTESFSLTSNDSGRMKVLYKDLLLKLKSPEMENLGVLQKIDLDQLEQLVPDPTAGWTTTKWSWKDKMAEFENLVSTRLDSAASSHGFTVDPLFKKQLGLQSISPDGGRVPVGAGASGSWQKYKVGD